MPEPVTVAVNCWVPPEETEAVVGDMETDTALMVAVAEADLVVSA